MSQFVVLRNHRISAYERFGITFLRNAPREVENNEAAFLLTTGLFSSCLPFVASDVDDGLENYVGSAKNVPKNELCDDDLNGKRILLRRPGAIGDSIFAAQFGAYLKSKYPRAVIDVAVRAEVLPLLQPIANIDNVITVTNAAQADTVFNYDYIIPFGGVIEDRGSDDEDYYKLHFERAGMTTFQKDIRMPLLRLHPASSDTVQAADVLLTSLGLQGTKYVVVLAGASSGIKAMNRQKLADICEALTRSEGDFPRLNVLLIGGPLDRIPYFDSDLKGNKLSIPVNVATELQAHDMKLYVPQPSNKFLSVANHQNLAISGELIRRSLLVYGGDTGLLHYAQAIGKPTVSYWGATDPENTLTHAPNADQTVWLKSSTKCAPCRQTKLSRCDRRTGDHAECMDTLDTSGAVRAIRTVLSVTLKEKTAQDVAGAFAASFDADSQSAPVMSVESFKNTFNGRSLNAFILFDHENQWTGGGMYLFSLGDAFARRSCNHAWVILRGTGKFVYTNELSLSCNMHFVADHKGELLQDDLPDGFAPDLIIAGPESSDVAVRFAKAHPKTQSICTLYDTPKLLAEFRKDHGQDLSEYNAAWLKHLKAMQECNHVLAVSKYVKAALVEEQPKLQSKTFTVAPCIADGIADGILDPKNISNRERSITLIARNVKYKRTTAMIELLCNNVLMQEASQDAPITINVIGHGAERIRGMLRMEWLRKGISFRLLENCPEKTKWDILGRSRCLVHMSDFEGFGIVLAEAMYAGTPVVCRKLPVYEECFAYHPYYCESDELACVTVGHIWRAWDVESGSHGIVSQKDTLLGYIAGARAYVQNHYTRDCSRATIGLFLNKRCKMAQEDSRKSIVAMSQGQGRVAIVTPWGNRCGIAETSREFVEKYSCQYRVFAPRDTELMLVHKIDPDYVTRCWDRDFRQTAMLVDSLVGYGANVVHFEHEFSLFKDERNFTETLTKLRTLGMKTVVTLHTFFNNRLVGELPALSDAVIVTKLQRDYDYPNVHCVPLPCRSIPKRTPQEARTALDLRIPSDAFVVGSHGFWNPHKGMAEFMHTYSEVNSRCGDAAYYMLSGRAPNKLAYYDDARSAHKVEIKLGRIILTADYAPFDVVAQRLQACDLLVFNYSVATHSSASAAIRDAMAAQRPIICTDSPMFSEFEHGVHVWKIPFQSSTAKAGSPKLTEAILKLRSDKELCAKLVKNSNAYVLQHQPKQIAKMHEQVYASLMIQ